MSRTTNYKPALAFYSMLVVFATTFLLYAGGFTTSIGAGMVFPDWPLSNGSLNPDGWLENRAMMAEHSHRLLGATIGLLTLSLAVWVWLKDDRKWMRTLAVASLIAVVLQGLLGGFRVLFNNLQFAMIHGCLAQIFLCMLVSIAAGQSGWWHRILHFPAEADGGNHAIKRTGLVLCGFIFVQLIIAAVMRHSGAGLA
ncbi:MAG: COX15/CtaA family protein, partial [Verrucomicrobiae bacterium]|nr:COX15/CtaA family protein [Verrucomicrobiae bacterium]